MKYSNYAYSTTNHTQVSMSNDISGKYFTHTYTYEAAAKLFAQVAERLGFISEKEIFCGRIYNSDKVGSLIHKGMIGHQACILKLQILELPIDEQTICEGFNAENHSKKVRLPKVIAAEKWSKETGYGYLLMEEIEGEKIYAAPFATREEQNTFLEMYQEYRGNSLPKRLVEPHVSETSSVVFSFKRLSHWAQIGEEKGTLTPRVIQMWEDMLLLAPTILKDMPMEFQHGHLTMDDVRMTEEGSFVLMSNLYWSYRPQYYDTTFHLWAGIKTVTDLTINSEEVIAYVERWRKGYEELAVIMTDQNFRRKFAVMMGVRCLAAVIIDIHAQNYLDNREAHISHLNRIFSDLFDWCVTEMTK